MTSPPLLEPVGSETAPVEPTVAPAVERPRPVAPPPAASGWSTNLIAIAVASALFMEFIDSTALSTALPTLARAFHSDPVHLKLALTSYLLALAVFAPASGWVADRFGARRVFISAMLVFLFGSALCGFSRSLPELVGARIVQGMGGAMMTPVGRLIIVGAAPRDRFVQAMTWFSMPAMVGPLLGPPLSGIVLGVASWPWIFFINLPVGAIGMTAVAAFVPRMAERHPGRFDSFGFALAATAITALVFLAETFGVGLIPAWVDIVAAVVGCAAFATFVRHALRAPNPVLDLKLFSVPTYRAAMTGGTLSRLGLGASPLLLPLLLQLGLGWSPFQSGIVTISQSIGAFTFRPAAPILIKKLGFRRVLFIAAAATAVFTAAPATFVVAPPIAWMVVMLALAGFARSSQFSSANALAYADVPRHKISQASTLSTVIQQIGMSLGVSFGALTLHLARGGGHGALVPSNFILPFMMIGVFSAMAVPVYWRLEANAGEAFSGRAATS